MRSTWLVKLYPARWRRRFGDEFEALLEEEPLTPRMALDVVAAAVAAWRDPFPASEEPPMTRTRVQVAAAALAALAVLPATIFFVAVIGRGFQPTQHEPARTLNEIAGMFLGMSLEAQVALLLVGPALALMLGGAVLVWRLAADTELRGDLAAFGAASMRLLRHRAVVLAALAVAASAFILAALIVHSIVG